MNRLRKSTFNTIAISFAMVFFVDYQLMAHNAEYEIVIKLNDVISLQKSKKINNKSSTTKNNKKINIKINNDNENEKHGNKLNINKITNNFIVQDERTTDILEKKSTQQIGRKDSLQVDSLAKGETIGKRLEIKHLSLDTIYVDTLKLARIPVNVATKPHKSLFYKTFIDSTSRYSYREIPKLFRRSKRTPKGVIKEQDPTLAFRPYAHKQIAEIRYIRLRAFGQSIHDLERQPDRWYQKLGNTFHKTTLQMLIAHNVLFKPDDKLKPIDLAETEQLLRSRPYIEDARLIVETLPDTSKVRITVVTKDKFTIGGHLHLSSPERWDVGLYERNFAGAGVVLKTDVYHDKSLVDYNGYKLELRVDNIWGSFVSANTYYRQGVGFRTKYLNVSRDFSVTKMRLAGGLTYKDSEERYGVFLLDSTITVKYRLKDAWLGYAFPISGQDIAKAPYLLTFATKLRFTNYDKGLKPTPPTKITPPTHPYFFNTKHYLISVGVTRQNFYQSNMIHLFGATEDIPVGMKVQLATGFEQDDYQRRYLINGDFSGAQYFKFGYLYGAVQIATYITQKKKMEQSLLHLNTQYISQLFNVGQYQVRQFVTLDYMGGFKRFRGEHEYIVLGHYDGIRGLRSNRLMGQRRMYANFETISYSPYDIWGFRIAFFGFVDIGHIDFGEEKLSDRGLFGGFGLGVRLRNESTVFPTIMLGLSYYPRVPVDGRANNYYLRTQGRGHFEQFRSREPELLPFR